MAAWFSGTVCLTTASGVRLGAAEATVANSRRLALLFTKPALGVAPRRKSVPSLMQMVLPASSLVVTCRTIVDPAGPFWATSRTSSSLVRLPASGILFTISRYCSPCSSMTYTGEEAVRLWAAYRAVVVQVGVEGLGHHCGKRRDDAERGEGGKVGRVLVNVLEILL